LRVAFRVDGGRKLGLGHLSRCISLANFLSSKKIESIFLISDYSIKNIICSNNHNVEKINPGPKEVIDILKIIKKNNCKVLVIDSKRSKIPKIIQKIRTKTKVVLIDNIKAANFADLVILPGVKELFRNPPSNSLIGLDYFLLNTKAPIKKTRKKNKTIFFSAGGSDKRDITSKIVSVFLKKKQNFKMIIVLGKFYSKDVKIKKMIGEDERFILYKDPENFLELMSKSTLGIITFGVTAYEAAALKLPVFIISHSNENHQSAKIVEKYGWSKYFGKYDSVNYSKVADEVISSLDDKPLLKKMSNAGNVIDGKGTKRVADTILNLAFQQ
jgi:spore coat polysaccharide biosynthesis predicted glycosyltransferase SpsG